MYKSKRLPIEKRLTSRIKISLTDCWEYQGQLCNEGYGILKYKPFNETLAHRVSYILFKSKGNSIKGLCVCHHCDNPKCLNPKHLFLGTWDDNNKDRAKKGRTITPNLNLKYCKRGHEFTIENTIFRRSGTRLCKKCNNEGSRLRYHKNKGNLNEPSRY